MTCFPSFVRSLALGLAAGLLLPGMVACTGQAPRIEPHQDRIQAYRAGAWQTPAHGTLVSQSVALGDPDNPLTVTWKPGSDTRPRPVVVFLPGLGQSSREPNRWVDAWADAGYVVLRLQPLAQDAGIWTSLQARNGDFDRVAVARFAPRQMEDRLMQLAARLRRLPGAALPSNLPASALNWQQVVLAGDDLGAYTVQALLRATHEKSAELKLDLPFRPVAALLVSPLTRGASDLPASAAPLALPVLMISSQDDLDPYGIVHRLEERHLAFATFAPEQAYYLELNHADHAWLSDGLQMAPADVPPAVSLALRDDTANPHSQRSRGGHGDGVAPEDDVLAENPRDMARLKADREKQLARWVERRADLLTQITMSELSVEQVSLAFLDAYTRQDPTALTWLSRNAETWLSHNGDRLKHHSAPTP